MFQTNHYNVQVQTQNKMINKIIIIIIIIIMAKKTYWTIGPVSSDNLLDQDKIY